MLKMPIARNVELDHPILCSDCGEPAQVLLFERGPLAPGIVAHLRKVGAKCAGHLTMDENGLATVAD